MLKELEKLANTVIAVFIITIVIFYSLKAITCLKTEEGWLTLENQNIPKGCYIEKKGNSYKVKLKPCGILDGKIDVLCPDGREVIFYKAHGEFVTKDIIYKF
ncbi:hypothetical protein [Desulfurobacterium sp.]